MKRFTSCSTSGVQDYSEQKAVAVALVCCFLFIGFLAVVYHSVRRDRRFIAEHRRYSGPPPPPRPAQVPPVLAELPKPPDANSRFRFAPINFESVDFKNRSYGHYMLSNGDVIELTLTNGRFQQSGTSNNLFDLTDVLYTDLTGDSIPEAIVLLSHLECGRTCDGGKNLIYVYSSIFGGSAGGDEILRYESGSGRDGCSLKSVTVKNRKLALELFGRCPQPEGFTADPTIRDTYEVTRVAYRFNGKYLLAGKRTYQTLIANNDVSWGVDINISDERTPKVTSSKTPSNSVAVQID